ncbi:unnamed protein product [Ceratitis capitata]|uniref:(Mediterranean fruit fly) hypothetical protein n=1 Tax=Ceratitis capitata TaxID=7213 RepID=A0A811UH21_CERCA|nr:unnamed protein product [Ceratitis capitata]
MARVGESTNRSNDIVSLEISIESVSKYTLPFNKTAYNPCNPITTFITQFPADLKPDTLY